jgi:hypothetical protein
VPVGCDGQGQKTIEKDVGDIMQALEQHRPQIKCEARRELIAELFGSRN